MALRETRSHGEELSAEHAVSTHRRARRTTTSLKSLTVLSSAQNISGVSATSLHLYRQMIDKLPLPQYLSFILQS
eukprot:6192986-Pleurochrysis_carterae.AAC.1